jgi:GGDEF domain-containing protein
MPLTFTLILSLTVSGVLCWRLRRLQLELNALAFDVSYGILTRQGLDRHWRQTRHAAINFEIVFMDLDAMHLANERLGYEEVDRRIRASFGLRATDVLIARWYSGDEIVAIVPVGDGHGMAERILACLQTNGLSATCAIAPAQCNLTEAVKAAATKVQTAKAENRRGTIN